MTPGQAEQYARQGYLVFDPALDPAWVAAAREEVERRLDDIRLVLAMRGEDRRRRETEADLNWKSGAVRQLITAEPFLRVAAGLLGGDVDMRHCLTLTKTSDHGEPVPWHQDWGLGADAGYPFFTFWIALTDADAGNGCLDVMPGSHTGSVLPHVLVNPPAPDKGIAEPVVGGAVSVPMRAGEAMVIHPALIHGSGRNRSGRPRVALLVGFQRPKPAYDEFWGKAGARVLRNGRADWGPLEWK